MITTPKDNALNSSSVAIPRYNAFFKYALDIIIKIEYLSYMFVNDNIFSEIVGAFGITVFCVF